MKGFLFNTSEKNAYTNNQDMRKHFSTVVSLQELGLGEMENIETFLKIGYCNQN